MVHMLRNFCSTRVTSFTALSVVPPPSTLAVWTIFIRILTKRTYVFSLHYGDLTDATNLIRIVQETKPDEIYNLAAQSHVQVSFETPEYTANARRPGYLAPARGNSHSRDAATRTFFIRHRSRSFTVWCERSPSVRPRDFTHVPPMLWQSFMPTGSP